MTKTARQYPGASRYRDRHGVWRWRFRKRSFSAELGTEYGSEDFERRYQAAVQGRKLPQGAGASRTRPGSFSAAIESYYSSPAYMDLADSTKRGYRSVIEPMREAHGTKLLGDMRPRHVLSLMAEKSETPGAANNRLKRLRQILDHAVAIDMIAVNPARDPRVKFYRMGSEGFHTWSEEEIAAYFATHALGSTAYLAMTLMLFTGASRADAVRLGWGNLRGGGGCGISG